MLLGGNRGEEEKGLGVGGSRVSLADVNTERMFGLKYKLVYNFKLTMDMVRVASESLFMCGWTSIFEKGADGIW